MFNGGRITKSLKKEFMMIGGYVTSNFYVSAGFRVIKLSIKDKILNSFSILLNVPHKHCWQNEYLLIEYYEDVKGVYVQVYLKSSNKIVYSCCGHLKCKTLDELIKKYERDYKLEQLIKKNPTS